MKIGVVLCGGFAKGAYQAGFLKALQEKIKRENIVAVSGASIGVINAYAFAANKLDDLEKLWKEIHFDSMVDLTLQVWFKKYFKKILAKIIKEDDVLDVPLYAPIVYLPFINYDYGKLTGEYTTSWRNFILGTMSFPIFSGGIHFFRGQISFDGGAIDNVPILPILKNEKPDVIIAAHFNSRFKPRKYLLEDDTLVLDYDITITDNISRTLHRTFDFTKEGITDMFQFGYEYGLNLCEEIFGDLQNIETIKEKAQKRKQDEKEKRESGAFWDETINMVNKIAHPFFKHDGKNIKTLTKKIKRRNKF
ncbi:MAG: patatin-like phospholipase family protein [Clostridia bacterium]|nr:patatin-like phospholipase family protein [Clostridia bacterium]